MTIYTIFNQKKVFVHEVGHITYGSGLLFLRHKTDSHT